MKTISQLLLAALLSGAASVAVAGPGPQFWNRPPTKPIATLKAAKPAATSDNSVLTCTRMLVPRIGAAKQPPVMVVNCTPEMMKNDWRCQQACAKAQKE